MGLENGAVLERVFGPNRHVWRAPIASPHGLTDGTDGGFHQSKPTRENREDCLVGAVGFEPTTR